MLASDRIPSGDPVAFRPAQAAKRYSLSRRTIYNLIESGQLPFYKVGSATLILDDDLRRVITGDTDASAT